MRAAASCTACRPIVVLLRRSTRHGAMVFFDCGHDSRSENTCTRTARQGKLQSKGRTPRRSWPFFSDLSCSASPSHHRSCWFVRGWVSRVQLLHIAAWTYAWGWSEPAFIVTAPAGQGTGWTNERPIHFTRVIRRLYGPIAAELGSVYLLSTLRVCSHILSPDDLPCEFLAPSLCTAPSWLPLPSLVRCVSAPVEQHASLRDLWFVRELSFMRHRCACRRLTGAVGIVTWMVTHPTSCSRHPSNLPALTSSSKPFTLSFVSM